MLAPQFERLWPDPERARYLAIIAAIQVTTDTPRITAKTTAHPVPPLLRFPTRKKAAKPIGNAMNHRSCQVGTSFRGRRRFQIALSTSRITRPCYPAEKLGLPRSSRDNKRAREEEHSECDFKQAPYHSPRPLGVHESQPEIEPSQGIRSWPIRHIFRPRRAQGLAHASRVRERQRTSKD